jgi:2,3-bisphosphoglycerate-independent phosphoglycerate mutase
MKELLDYIAQTGSPAKIASVSGRYYAMDRDRRWERTELAYRAIVYGEGTQVTDPLEAIQQAYDAAKTDEFILPVVVTEKGNPVAPMRDGDAVICFNYRSDRMRQIVRALIDPAFDGFDVARRPKVSVTTLTNYDKTFPVPVAFAPTSMDRILAEVLSARGLCMLKTAETEKYPHVTYFFNGGVEQPYPCEHRVMVPSPKVATYDLMPEMSAPGIADNLVADLTSGRHQVVICNFANADMVGHTGSVEATIKAVETLDGCLGRIMTALRSVGGTAIVTSDHGNAEQMWDDELNAPHTAHTSNPVPVVLCSDAFAGRRLKDGSLRDVAPTILDLLDVPLAAEMTGRTLIEK